ncbi:MAG: AAA family ATPase [bacterium]|nr:AAA family ATPase [bacterium]
MAIQELWVKGYRSVRNIRLPLGRVNVLVGPNGCGKSNLYRAIVLLAAAARGTLARALASEGGMPSVLWAGPRKKGSVRMELGVRVDDWTFDMTAGLPKSGGSYPPDAGEGAAGLETCGGLGFPLDPSIKTEKVRYAPDRGRTIVFLEREEAAANLRDADGTRITHRLPLMESESALSQIREPHRYPELSALRQEMVRWRFYHQFRTDGDSPLRKPQVVAMTPTLSPDGDDLAAALQTVVAANRREELARAVDKAFPGAILEFPGDSREARFTVGLRMPGIVRPFQARELSDGTLRYLCLLAALLSPQPPTLIALNEPETSIHPDLIEPLAQLIVEASRESQLWITTHSRVLADRIAEWSGEPSIELEMAQGETLVVGQGLLDR